MSRRAKRSKEEKRRRHRRRDPQRFQAVVQDTAGIFTCSSEAAGHFEYQCHSRGEDLECDLAYARLAYAIWADHQGPAQQLGPLLADLVTEYERHFDALTHLAHRLAAIASVPELQHVQLGQPEAYYDLVWRHIFPTVPRPTPTDSSNPTP